MKMMISCKEATHRISKAEEGKLSLLQRFQLWLHLAICVFCKAFYRQNKIIIRNTAHIHEYSDVTLTTEEKETIVRKMEEVSS